MIAQSWLRCRRDGVNPELERAPTESGLEEIGTILRVTDFGRAGQQVLNSFSPFVDGSGHLIVLADVGGRILYTVGNRGIQGLLERINFCPGGAWAEDIAGSNGVGTPLRSGQPEIVLGTEHYCRGWQPWVCYGCPVRAPGSGQPIGVVDVTGPALKAHAKNMMLTSSVARAVDQQLLLFHLQRRNALLTSYRDMERRYPNEGIVVIDQDGLIVEVNSSALRILRMSPTTILGGSLATLAPDLWALFREGFQRKEDMSVRLEIETLEFARRTTACHAELLAAGGM